MDERRVALVIEPDGEVRGTLGAILARTGFEIHCAEGGSNGVALAAEVEPDLITMALDLPDIDGFEAIRRIRWHSEAHLVVVSSWIDEADVVYGLQAGADDYLGKPLRCREFRARVDALLRRRERLRRLLHPETWSERQEAAELWTREARGPKRAVVPGPAGAPTTMRPRLLVLNDLVVEPAGYTALLHDEELPLTPTEFALLHAILRLGRMVRSKQALVRELRDGDAESGTFVSAADVRSIEVHVANLRRKLGDDALDPRWIETVRGLGYRAARPR